MTEADIVRVDDDVPPGSAAVTREQHRWAAQTLLGGTSVAYVVQTLVTRGVPETDAAVLCAEIFADPVFDVARREMEQRRKQASVLTMLERMKRLDAPTDVVEQRSGLTREEFLASYYARNEPVILTDVCADWPACSLWTSPDYLIERLGDAVVEVMADRDSDPDYEFNSGNHRREMSYADYVSSIGDVTSSNDVYLVANNKLLVSDDAKVLWEDFTLDPRYLDSAIAQDRTFYWHGPAGTITPLHHDVMNLLFCQVVGWKSFTLIPAAEIPFVYNSRAVYSDVDPSAVDLHRHPEFAKAHPRQVKVGPGQSLFIPAGWWHRVEALETSISVSTAAFVYPNQLEWFAPKRIR